MGDDGEMAHDGEAVNGGSFGEDWLGPFIEGFGRRMTAVEARLFHKHTGLAPSDAARWIALDFGPYETGRYLAAGIDLEAAVEARLALKQAHEAQEATAWPGFSYREMCSWKAVGVDSGVDAAVWRSIGFSAVLAEPLVESGMAAPEPGDVEVLNALLDVAWVGEDGKYGGVVREGLIAGLAAREVSDWFRLGSWMPVCGFVGQEAVAWRDAGFDPVAAGEWGATGLGPTDARRLADQGVIPANVPEALPVDVVYRWMVLGDVVTVGGGIGASSPNDEHVLSTVERLGVPADHGVATEPWLLSCDVNWLEQLAWVFRSLGFGFVRDGVSPTDRVEVVVIACERGFAVMSCSVWRDIDQEAQLAAAVAQCETWGDYRALGHATYDDLAYDDVDHEPDDDEPFTFNPYNEDGGECGGFDLDTALEKATCDLFRDIPGSSSFDDLVELYGPWGYVPTTNIDAVTEILARRGFIVDDRRTRRAVGEA